MACPPPSPSLEGETVKAHDAMGTQASVSAKRMAAEAGFAVSGEVILKKKQNFYPHNDF